MDDFKKHLNKVQIDILQTIADGLDQEVLKEEDPPLIADFVTSKISSIKNEYQLEDFLKELASRWRIFIILSKFEHEVEVEKEDDEAASGTQALIDAGKLDDALALAKHATE